jgi:hypothetical protein
MPETSVTPAYIVSDPCAVAVPGWQQGSTHTDLLTGGPHTSDNRYTVDELTDKVIVLGDEMLLASIGYVIG